MISDGNITLSGTDENRTLELTSVSNESGTANITVTVDDGTETTTETFAVTVNPVNDAPTATADSFSTDEDSVFTTGNVLDNDTDVDGDMLTVSAIDVTSTIGEVIDNEDGTFNI